MKKVLTIWFSCILVLMFVAGIMAKSNNEYTKELKAAASDLEKINVMEAWGNSGNKPSKIAITTLSDVLLNGVTSELRRKAAQTLGKMKTGRVALETAFKNDDKYVRQFAMQALANIASTKSIIVFRNGYKDKRNPDVKYWALVGLSKAGSKKDSHIFRSALKGEWIQSDAIAIALLGLGKYGKASDWRYIKPYCLKLNEPHVIAGLKAAGMLRNKSALSVIERHMANANANIAKAAIEAIGNFSGYDIISTLVRFKHAHPADVNMDMIHKMLQKNKAAAQYAILKNNMNLRKSPNERSDVVTVIMESSVVEILPVKKGKRRRKYIITDGSGQELEDYWYQIKTAKGKRGYLFGAYVDIVNTK